MRIAAFPKTHSYGYTIYSPTRISPYVGRVSFGYWTDEFLRWSLERGHKAAVICERHERMHAE